MEIPPPGSHKLNVDAFSLPYKEIEKHRGNHLCWYKPQTTAEKTKPSEKEENRYHWKITVDIYMSVFVVKKRRRRECGAKENLYQRKKFGKVEIIFGAKKGGKTYINREVGL